MPVTFYVDADADLALIRQRKVGVIGYGSQGHAHALNLRDAGVDVTIGLYPGSLSQARAEASGFEVVPVDALTRRCDVLSFQLPDERQPEVYHALVAPHLRSGQALVFSHGYNVRYGQIQAPAGVDLLLVAPFAPGPLVRSSYVEGRGVPAAFGVAQDASGHGRALALAYARAIGCTRVGVLESTFAEETETDLFAEQVVLCGGVAALVRAAFDTLVAAGYAPEVAYISCLHELKQTVELMQRHGIAGMNGLISNTAEYGEYVAGPRLITEETRAAMRGLLGDVQSGRFAEAWSRENHEGLPLMRARRDELAAATIETVGAAMRERLGLNR